MAEALLPLGVEKLLDLLGAEKLLELLVREADRFKEVDQQFSQIKSDVNFLRSFLKDADAKKHSSEVVKSCVDEIKEIVFDAEDVIKTFLLKEELSKRSGIKRRLSFFIVDCRELGSEIGGISDRISKVISKMQIGGVQQTTVHGGECSHPLQEIQREMRRTYASNNESNLVGLEDNVKKLVGYLLEEESNHVVSIIGMGGIGKTTLARQVFHHEMIKAHFDGVVWVCISQQFTKKYVWQTMLKKLSSKHDENRVSNMTEDDLQEALFKLLETSKSLIIFDDMWKEEDWDRLKHVFPSKKEWKILLTSRNEKVGLHVDPTCVTFKPECLTLDDSWTLFKRIAFPNKDTSGYKIDVQMEEMGKKMIKQCGGLPLAVKVLGGLLAGKQSLSEWKTVCEKQSMSPVHRVDDTYHPEGLMKNPKLFLGEGGGDIDKIVDIPKVLEYISAERTKITIDKDSDFPTGKYGAKSERFCSSDAKTNANLLDSKVIPPQIQVFINFRGVQVRNNFVGYLVHELRKREVNVFIDNYEKRGEDLSTLFKRIEESGIAIVVFSSMYAESKWCLDELVKIEERVHQGLLKVIPIFYKVSPTHVKKLKGEFGDHFRDKEDKYGYDSPLIKAWKKAIVSVTHKHALVYDGKSDTLEIVFVETIVKHVLEMLHSQVKAANPLINSCSAE